MGAFLFGAVGLVAATLLGLLRPWQRLRADGGVAPSADPAHRHTAWLIAIALPLAATGLYAMLGTPAALLASAPQATTGSAHEVSAADIERMVAGLSARLEKNPSDSKGWSMLARSYHALGRIDEARVAFERIGNGLYQDAGLLAEYADVLATQAGGQLEGPPLRLVQAALLLDPDQPMALSLAATAAYKRQDLAEAARHWQQLLKQLPPDSEDAQWVMKTLAEIRAAPARP